MGLAPTCLVAISPVRPFLSGPKTLSRKVFLLTFLVFSTASAGCWSYSYRPVEVTVTHHDTGKPAVGVPVRAYYLGMMVLNLPKAVEGVTDANGRVILSIADCGACFDIDKTGYYAERSYIRDGGRLPYKSGPNGGEPLPPHIVTLTPVPATPLMQRIRKRLAIVQSANTYKP
jgi:hypothetical protein